MQDVDHQPYQLNLRLVFVGCRRVQGFGRAWSLGFGVYVQSCSLKTQSNKLKVMTCEPAQGSFSIEHSAVDEGGSPAKHVRLTAMLKTFGSQTRGKAWLRTQNEVVDNNPLRRTSLLRHAKAYRSQS